MTLPNGPDGLSPNIDLAFPLTGDPTGDDQALSKRPTFDQPTVEDMLKAQMKASAGWQSAHQVGYAGLPSGVPLVVAMFIKLAEQLTGIPAQTWVDQWLANPVLAALDPLVSDTLAKIFTVSVNMQSLFFLNFNDPDFDASAALLTWIETVLLPTGLFEGVDWSELYRNLTGIDDENARVEEIATFLRNNLFGPIDPSRVGTVPSSSITNTAIDLLLNGTFEGSGSIVGYGIWTWDSSVYYRSGAATPGAAKVVLDGLPKALRSNKIDVEPGTRLELTAEAAWKDITTFGPPIEIAIIKYDAAGVEIGQEVLDTAGPPGDTTPDWDALPAGASSVELFSLYTVPADVAQVEYKLAVDTVATAGTVWFGKASVIKRGGYIQDLIDGIINSMLAWVGIDYTIDDLSDVVAAQANAVKGTTAQMIQILAAFSDGNPDADDFDRVNATDLGPKWAIYQTGTGVFATPNGTEAEWSGFYPAEFVAYKTDVQSASDNQIVTVILGSSPEYGGGFFIFPPTDYGYNDLWLRMSTFTSWGTRTGLRWRLGTNKPLSLTWYNGGTPTTIWEQDESDTHYWPVAGAVVEFQCGVPGDPLRMLGRLNGDLIMDERDSSAISSYGENYRRRGLGGEVQASIPFLVLARPGRYKQWTAQG